MKVLRLSVVFLIAVGFLFACQNSTDAVNEKTEAPGKMVKADTGDIEKGKAFFGTKCIFCHDTKSTKKIVGPGLKGILKNDKLPVSGKPATADNIANQLKNPYQDMSSFSYLSDEEVQNIISYLNTL